MSEQERGQDQLTLLYAALLAKKCGIELCPCKTLRCKICLNCLTTHCLCGRDRSKQTATPPKQPITSLSIRNLIAYYLKARRTPIESVSVQLQGFCGVCQDSQALGRLRCNGCQIMMHANCIKIDQSKLPLGVWYCKQCLPDLVQFFYPPKTPPVISLLERARVLQIVSGQASRLSEEDQIAIVEEYARHMKVGDNTQLFVYRH